MNDKSAANQDSAGQGVVLVTGASSGIGLAIARQLIDSGYEVIGLARNFARSGFSHKNFHQELLDLSDIGNLTEGIKSVVSTINNPVRGLINNVGIGKMGYLEQLSVPDIQQLMNTNFLSHVLVTKALLPRLKHQDTRSDIVFMGSEAGLRGAQQGSIYCASKFALRGFAQALREECAKSGVHVSLLNPGAVRTGFFDSLSFEPGEGADNAIEADDIARLVLAVMEMRDGCVVDEINLSPLKRVWQRREN